MSDWKLGRRRGGCSDCERDFLDGEPHHSILVIEAAEIGRVDVCRECFGGREIEDSVLWWRTKHRVQEKQGVQLDLESIQALFGALGEREETGWLELRYLLCLILMRKRRLKVTGVKREGDAEFFVVKKPRVEGEERVRVFDFTPERQSQLRETLAAIFEGADLDELDPDGKPAEEAEGVEGEASENGEATDDSSPEDEGGEPSAEESGDVNAEADRDVAEADADDAEAADDEPEAATAEASADADDADESRQNGDAVAASS